MVSHDFPMPRRQKTRPEEVEIMRTPSEKPTVASEVPPSAAFHQVIGSVLGIINGITRWCPIVS